MADTLIVNARLVNEGREFDGDLRIEGDRIAAIGSGLSARANETVVDVAGRRLLPGMIDDQVHFREPGMEHKADIASESYLGLIMDRETQRPVLRVTNVGITAYITPRGEVLDAAPSYAEDVRVWDVPRSDGSQTVYVRFGDWFAWLSLVVTVGLAIWGMRRSVK